RSRVRALRGDRAPYDRSAVLGRAGAPGGTRRHEPLGSHWCAMGERSSGPLTTGTPVFTKGPP
ncbi:MAG: hypothetical protein M3O55_00230, partial [Actinomycetota bacterium]|nr:hypothetical protein [Actinomycetota bacterium]